MVSGRQKSEMEQAKRRYILEGYRKEEKGNLRDLEGSSFSHSHSTFRTKNGVIIEKERMEMLENLKKTNKRMRT